MPLRLQRVDLRVDRDGRAVGLTGDAGLRDGDGLSRCLGVRSHQPLDGGQLRGAHLAGRREFAQLGDRLLQLLVRGLEALADLAQLDACIVRGDAGLLERCGEPLHALVALRDALRVERLVEVRGGGDRAALLPAELDPDAQRTRPAGQVLAGAPHRLRGGFQLRLHGLGSPDGEHRVPCALCRVRDRSPALLQRAESAFQLGRAVFRDLREPGLSDRRRLGRLALPLQRADLLVEARRQELGRLVQPLGRLARVAREVGERLGGLFGSGSACPLHADCSLGQRDQFAAGDLRRGRKLRQHLGASALRGPCDAGHCGGHLLQLADGRAGRVAREHERAAVAVDLLGALLVRERPGRSDCRHTAEGQSQRGQRAGQRPRSVAHAAEAVLDLPALLQQHQEGALPACELRGDVGELRRQLPHRCGRLRGRDPDEACAVRGPCCRPAERAERLCCPGGGLLRLPDSGGSRGQQLRLSGLRLRLHAGLLADRAGDRAETGRQLLGRTLRPHSCGGHPV